MVSASKKNVFKKKYETLAGRVLIRDALREHMLCCADFETGFETFFRKLFFDVKKKNAKNTLIFSQKSSLKTVTTGLYPPVVEPGEECDPMPYF